MPDVRVTTLSPQFTYTIFGDQERIFGYKGLSIVVSISADTLLTLLEIKYDERIAPSLGVEAEDLDAAMSVYLPEDTFRSRPQWEKKCKDKTRRFQPMGQKLTTYTIKGAQYTIYKTSLTDSDFIPHLERMQLFSILYIEGASLIDVEDPRFDVYTIYSEDNDHYEFVGYSTCYKYYFYDRKLSSFDYMRYRISQFVIVPSHQSSGHGGYLYDAIIESCDKERTILEVTVEDPSEAFDDLRDRRDLLRIERYPGSIFTNISLPLDKAIVEQSRRYFKTSSRQFARLIEMKLLQGLSKRDQKQQRMFRQLVKTRLFLKNKDVLAELPRTERLQKLEETYQTQTADYRRLLDGLRKPVTDVNVKNSELVSDSYSKLSDTEDLINPISCKKQRIN